MKNSNSKKISASTFTAWMMTIAFIALTAVSSLPALAQKKGVNWNHDKNIDQAVTDAFNAYQAGGISGGADHRANLLPNPQPVCE